MEEGTGGPDGTPKHKPAVGLAVTWQAFLPYGLTSGPPGRLSFRAFLTPKTIHFLSESGPALAQMAAALPYQSNEDKPQ